ncbi:UDP-N-acetylglucosamine transporter TMEM241 isoform X12 [Haliaeetus albicilla]|uniref:UDP-N-acetylglucosamine transporter TMEM241 isoform X12 n=1 Tax=Haliaeetus albicilla TaxID=8969 RepID=UPI0037E8175F
MYLKRPAGGLAFCLFYLASCFTNKYVLSVLKFTYPTLFQGWQTLVGGLLLHVSWKLGWVEINLCSRSEILSWLPASVLFVGIIYAGSRALSRLPIPVFLTVHNAAEVITCGFQKFVQKEQTSHLKVCSVLFLLLAAVCLPLCDTQFDPNGYLWALIHLICVVIWTNSTSTMYSGMQWICSLVVSFLDQVHLLPHSLCKVITASLSPFFFVMTANVLTISCLVISGVGEALLVYTERTGT